MPTDEAVTHSAGSPYTVSPQLASEAPKAPWSPTAVGRISFFFGPLAGAFVVVASLRRMAHPENATRVLLIALGAAAVASAILFFIPDALARFVGIGIEIGFAAIFPRFMQTEFNAWQTANPERTPSNGWNAVGWGLIGLVMYSVIAVIIFIGLDSVFPGRL
jgi:FtsH-binding integral membrane protein